MDNLLSSIGCLIVFVLGVVFFSATSIGTAGLLATWAFSTTGLWVSVLVIGGIGIAVAGIGIDGRWVLGILFALIIGLSANSCMLTMNSLPDQSSNKQHSVVATITMVPTTVPTLSIAITAEASLTSYGEIEDNYETMSRSEWKHYKRSLIGERVQWSGVVDKISTDSINIYMGQNKLTRRIYLADLPASTLDALKEHQSVEFEGTIYEISQILGLNLYLTDISFINTTLEDD